MADALVPLVAGAEASPRRPGTSDAGSAARGYGLVLLGAALFIVNAGVSRVVLDAGVEPTRLASLRSAGTAACLGLFLVATGRWRALALRRAELPTVLAYGVLGVALVQWFYFVAIDRLPIGIALLLEYLAPLLIALWYRFVLRRPVRALLWPAIGVTLAGLALVAQVHRGGAGLDPVGVLAGLGSAVAFATYFLAGERLVAHRDVVTTAFWGFAVSTVFLTLLAPWWQLPAATAAAPVDLPDPLGGGVVPVAALLVWVVVMGTLLPFGASTAALRHIPATAVSLVATVEPVGAALLAWWWFDEVLHPGQLLGVLLVVAGVALAVLAREPSR